jgi:hypothetical protein
LRKQSAYAANFEEAIAANTRGEQTGNVTVNRRFQNQTLDVERKDRYLAGAIKKPGNDSIDDKEIAMAISEVSCTGFKLTKAGRFILKKDPVNNAEDVRTRDGIENTNAMLVGAILDVANESG